MKFIIYVKRIVILHECSNINDINKFFLASKLIKYCFKFISNILKNMKIISRDRNNIISFLLSLIH